MIINKKKKFEIKILVSFLCEKRKNIVIILLV